MIADPQDRVAQLRKEARELPHSPTKVALLEEAVQLADSANDIDLGFAVRNELMEAANLARRPDVILVAFSWCLAQFDRNPDRFDRHTMMWKFKWVISNANAFPEVSRAQLDDLLAELERRHREHGSTLKAVWTIRRKLHLHRGELDEARAAHAELLQCSRDSMSDCLACEAYWDSWYHIQLREWDQAIKVAEPVLKNRLSCAEEPHCTLAIVLLPLAHLGRWREAKKYQRRGYQLVIAGRHFVSEQADHLQFLVMTGQPDHARRLLERHLPAAVDHVSLWGRFQFWLAGRFWATSLLNGGARVVKLRLPKGLPAPNAEGQADLGELNEWFTGRAQEIAQRFDARNGTDAFQRQMDELPELLELARRCAAENAV